MVVSSGSTPHHPRHYQVDYGYGGTSGRSGIARRSVHDYAIPQGKMQRYLCLSGGLLLTSYIPALLHVKSTHLLHLGFSRRHNAWKHAIRYAAASDPAQTYDGKPYVPTDYIRLRPTRPLDWGYHIWA
eukprot:6661863-Pyramimonas_sp.AAC.1